MRIRKLIYGASEPKYPGEIMRLSGNLPRSGALLRSPWFDAEADVFCTWTRIPDIDETETRESVFHVFREAENIPEILVYCTSVMINGYTYHLLMLLP
jgi:hypothetical protein